MVADNKEKQKVNVLWTGGYDSSFRMIDLSKKDVVVQPYYVSENRFSEKHELSAITEITSDIINHRETRCTILPVKICKKWDVNPDSAITKSYKILKKIVPIGSQYEWLARFAKQNDIRGLELGIEKASTSKVVQIFDKMNANLELVDIDGVSYYKLSEDNNDPDLYNVFGWFHYPNPLFNLTKIEVLQEYKNLGFEHVISKTWFCYRPIRNTPCGVCLPCQSALSEGMDFRFSKLGLARSKLSKFYTPTGVFKHKVRGSTRLRLWLDK